MSITSTHPRVLIRFASHWSPVGSARVIHDEPSGMRMLQLDLSAMAPTLFISVQDLLLLVEFDLPPLEAVHDAPAVGHA